MDVSAGTGRESRAAAARPRPRVLVLLPYPPRLDAPHGGRTTARLLARLGDALELGVLCLRPAGEPGVDRRVRDACVLVEEVAAPVRGRGPARWARVLAGLLSGRPIDVLDVHSVRFASRAAALVREWEPDVLHLEPIKVGRYLGAADGTTVARLLVHHEPASAGADAVWRRCRGPERAVRRLDAAAWHRFERRVLARLDAAVVFTDGDARAVRALAPELRVETIPFAGEIPPLPLDPLGADPPRLLFVGGHGHPPNADAAMRLARGIFPAVRRAHPEARLELVGADPPPALRELAGEGVAVAGRVPDVTPHLDAAAVVVAPIRIGGGMRVKVLEALAAGKAVVASPLAAAGLDVTHGEQLLLAETDEEFAAAVCGLLAEPDRRAALARRARAWSEANLGWDAPVAAFARLYESLAAGRLAPSR